MITDEIVRELSKVSIAPPLGVKQSIVREAYKVLSSQFLSSDFIYGFDLVVLP